VATDSALCKSICDYVDQHRDRLAALIAGLVRIPSENTPPVGAEGRCQEHLAAALRTIGWEATLYEPPSVPGVVEHPLYWPGRDYRGRPNLAARRKGAGGGRSLVLSGHIDTVPRGTQDWTRDPFGGEIDGNRLYGRGSNDMKAGVATNLFAAEAIEELGLELAGDLIFETVVDEEFGGVNGTLAGRLAGYNGDAAVISEPSFLRICPAQRGGRTAHITFSTNAGGVLTEGAPPAGVVDQLAHFLAGVKTFAAERRAAAPAHELYRACPDPVPVSITRIFTAPWGMNEPTTVPDTCRVEMFWQAMPGETQAEIDRHFERWFDALLANAPELYRVRPKVEFPIRLLPGSAIAESEPLVTQLGDAAREALGSAPMVAGIEGPCDMYVFHEFGIPAVLWGARGGNTHAADEYVELDSVAAAAKALLLFICRLCGAA
jgi:acetylornithine deacetylase